MLIESIDWIRLGCAFLTGAILTFSGSIIQNITNNDLASSSTLGIDALMVVLILGGFLTTEVFDLELQLSVLNLMILLSLILIVVLIKSMRIKKIGRVKLTNKIQGKISKVILMGLCLNLLVGAIFSLMHFFFISFGREFPTEVWYGNLRFSNLTSFMILLLTYLSGLFLCKKRIVGLESMRFGLDFSAGLGFDVQTLQWNFFIVAVILVGVVDILFGLFSFSGLIFPLILREMRFFKYSIRRELFWGPCLGGLLFGILDLACAQITISGAEIPVGLITAIFGSFFLLALFVKRFKKT